jgi:hypothetical protein
MAFPGLEFKHQPAATGDLATVSGTGRHLALDDDDECSLMHLMIIEALAGAKLNHEDSRVVGRGEDLRA